MTKRYFEGLNSLRFFAAAIVVLYHTAISLKRFDLPLLPDWPLFDSYKGKAAVQFFFTLSGFLITYLLMSEKERTKTISIRDFYIRRVLRIWPLYYIIVAFGLCFYFFLLPTLGVGENTNTFSLGTGIIAYVLFLPNLLYSLYHVGGILGITWSIGVEEQYYLFWAPLVKRFFKYLFSLIIGMWVVMTAIQIANAYHLLGISEPWVKFIKTIQFNYMAVGGFMAYMLARYEKRLMDSRFFSNGLVQVGLFVLIILYLVGYRNQFPVWVKITFLPMLFGWLILNVSANPRNVLRLSNPTLDWLGRISYGIYMYHYIWVYATSFLFSKTQFFVDDPIIFQLAFQLVIWGGTITTAHFSFNYLEKPILKLKHKFDR